jgi:hypothetical protein
VCSFRQLNLAPHQVLRQDRHHCTFRWVIRGWGRQLLQCLDWMCQRCVVSFQILFWMPKPSHRTPFEFNILTIKQSIPGGILCKVYRDTLAFTSRFGRRSLSWCNRSRRYTLSTN